MPEVIVPRGTPRLVSSFLFSDDVPIFVSRKDELTNFEAHVRYTIDLDSGTEISPPNRAYIAYHLFDRSGIWK